MSFYKRWLRCWKKRAEKRRARRILSELFDRPDLERISSLRPEHRARAVFLGYETRQGEISAVRFGMIRHPKPLRLPGVHHEVVELYRYEVQSGGISVEKSRNLTKKGTGEVPG